MNMQKEDGKESLIRRLEQEILDRKHESYIVLRRPHQEVIGHTLKLWGDLHRDFVSDNTKETPFHQKRDGMMRMTRAVSHCLRWFSEKRTQKIRLPNAHWRQLDEEALELIAWGIKYDKLFIEHTVWSKGFSCAEIDNLKQEVSFHYPTDIDFNFLFSQFDSEYKFIDDGLSRKPIGQIRKDLLRLLEQTGYAILTPLETKNLGLINRESHSFKVALQWLEETLWPQMKSTTSLGGYTLQDFRIFYAAIFCFSALIAETEELIDIHHGPENPAGSSVMRVTETELVGILSSMSGLSQKIVLSIVKDMTFDVNDRHANLQHQPFFKYRNKTYFTLVRWFSYILPELSLSYNLQRPSKKRVYDKILKELEQYNLEQINTNCRKRAGWFLEKEKSI